MTPILCGDVGIGERRPYCLGGASDVGHIDEIKRVWHGGFCLLLDGVKGAKARTFERCDPALLYFVDRHGIQIVQLLAPSFNGTDEIRGLESAEMLCRRLAGHGEIATEFGERLAVSQAQPVEHLAAGGIGERPEQEVVGHCASICR